MSAITAPAPPANTPAPAGTPDDGPKKKRHLGRLLAGLWLVGLIFFIAVLGFKPHKAPEVASGVYSPTWEFKLDTWFGIGPVDINKGVLYNVIAGLITVLVLWYVARRMRRKPGRLQVAVEWLYDMSATMVRDSLDDRRAKKYFPLVMTLFVFILVTNLMGYIPLPVNSMDKFNVFGLNIPSFQIYAADTNFAFPFILALMVFVIFTWERFKFHHGPIGFFKSLMPGGVNGPIKPMVFVIEVLSYLLRIVSLSVRLWANLLAGHFLISFMGGELGLLVGDPWVQWLLFPLGFAIYIFEATLIAVLQAFIFAILTAIYIGDSVTSH